jgi:hypothetical protein
MEKKSLFKKPENWGPKPEARLMSTKVEPNRARIEAKTAEMKAALETMFKKEVKIKTK